VRLPLAAERRSSCLYPLRSVVTPALLPAGSGQSALLRRRRGPVRREEGRGCVAAPAFGSV